MDELTLPAGLSSAARDAAMKWLARGSSGRRKCVMSPMDEMTWFQPPKISSYEVPRWPTAAIQVAIADPMRVSLYAGMVDGYSTPAVAANTIADFVIIGINDPNAEYAVSGFVVNAFTPGITLLESQFPGVVQGDLFATFTGSNPTAHDITLCVIEIRLRDWPRQ